MKSEEFHFELLPPLLEMLRSGNMAGRLKENIRIEWMPLGFVQPVKLVSQFIMWQYRK